MTDIYEESLAMHKAHGGKIAVTAKVPLRTKEDLSRAYSPGVAAVSGAIGKDPQAAKQLTIKKNTIAVISDGSAILGLGNLGPEAAIPVMEGKAALFKEFADVDAFPICVDTQDPDEIVDLVKKIAPVFGGVNLEDISAPRCFSIEERLRAELPIPVMHDDQHGTAIVVLAGLINALKLRGSSKDDVHIVVNGTGAAGVAIIKMLVAYGFTKIVATDSKGVLSPLRTDLNEEKKLVAELTQQVCYIDPEDPRCKSGLLPDAIKGADVFIGVSRAGLLTQDMVRAMNEQPIIFALANPEPEIMPGVAQEAGAFVVATGRSDFPNQVNNVLAFPGLFRGALDHGITQFTQEMFVAAAEAIAASVENPTPEKVIPGPFEKGIVEKVAAAVGSC